MEFYVRKKYIQVKHILHRISMLVKSEAEKIESWIKEMRKEIVDATEKKLNALSCLLGKNSGRRRCYHSRNRKYRRDRTVGSLSYG